jgi:hypothetical protein
MIVMIVIASFRVYSACQVPELGLRIIRLCCGLLRTCAVASGEAVTLANVVDHSRLFLQKHMVPLQYVSVPCNFRFDFDPLGCRHLRERTRRP